MTDITATEAARNFADLLDGIEHRGERYTIVRRGRAVAHLEPIVQSGGAAIKTILRRHAPDVGWSDDLNAVRSLIEIPDR